MRIVIVEDHELLLETLTAALNNVLDMVVIATARSVEEFEQIIEDPDLQPEVVVTDVDLRGRSGREVVELTNRSTDANAVVITGLNEEAGVRLAVDAGAAGFVSKAAPFFSLIEAIRDVAGGAAVYQPELLRARARARELDSPSVELTAREQEVLDQLAQGRSVPEIAEQLHISLHTVRNHVRAILSKFGARSQLEVVVKAVRAGRVEIRVQDELTS